MYNLFQNLSLWANKMWTIQQAYKRINIYNKLIFDCSSRMQPNNSQKAAFISMYKSGVRASYFHHMKQPQAIQKSKIQISQVQKQADEEIDEKTFALYRNFKRPQEDFSVQKRSGSCFISKAPMFGCFSKRKPFQINLNNSKLVISDKGQIQRYVDFSVVSSDINNHGKYFTISFQGSEKQIYIEPVSHEDVEKWCTQLNQIIKNTQGKQKHRTYLSRTTLDFFKYQHILSQQFQKNANSGDILLFQSPHSAATAQRLFTNSEYDHVGIVLRNKKNQLFIYESTAAEGVGLTPWKDLIKYQWYNLTNKICWRQLNANLQNQQIQIIQAFVAKTLGKQFEINLDKLFKFKSKLKRTDEYEEKKTYFCSQLLARLYKQLGYLDSQKSSTNYYPVDFSEKIRLKIVKPGISISNQKILSFDK